MIILLIMNEKMMVCEVCGRPGWGHHLLSKSVYPEFREEPLNLIGLCDWHHMLDPEMCPHGALRKQVEAFNGWVKRNCPERWAFMVAHSRRELVAADESAV